jgi:acetyl esterase
MHPSGFAACVGSIIGAIAPELDRPTADSLEAMASLPEPVERAIVRAVETVPLPAARLLAGRRVRVEGQELDPRVQLVLKLDKLAGGWTPMPPAELRELRRHQARVFRGRAIEVGAVRDLEIPTPDGAIAARRYEPASAPPAAPLVVYYHGGGHVIGDLDTHDQPCRFLARETPAVVLAVDYRLGPEHPFPAAVDDAVAAFRYAHDNAADLGADPRRIAVAGDSAGGNLAAVVAQLAVAEGGPAPAFQALAYPVTDYSSKRPSYDTFGEGFFLTREEMDYFRDNYFAEAGDRTDPRASPILADDLSGLPPAHVVTAGFDPLRDEGEDYARRLQEAGVPTTLRREPDLIHGFINAVGVSSRARDAVAPIAAAIRAGLERVESEPRGSAALP